MFKWVLLSSSIFQIIHSICVIYMCMSHIMFKVDSLSVSNVGYLLGLEVTCCYVITRVAVLGSAGGFQLCSVILYVLKCVLLFIYTQTVAADS